MVAGDSPLAMAQGTVKSVHGVKFSINASAYDMSPLLRAIDFHQVTGRWPVRVEVPAEGFGT